MSLTATRPQTDYLLRKLHSLSGLLPVGAFLAEHFWSNSAVLVGPEKYNAVSQELQTIPFRPLVEFAVIVLPILFHGGYGVYIWLRGKSNVSQYPWVGNWMYTLQRWTGGIAFIYIVWHVYTMRFLGSDLHLRPDLSFGKVQHEVFQTPLFLFYVVGLIAASWHFAYGIWLFAAKWGIVSGDRAQKRLLGLCLAFFLLLTGVGLASLTSFRSHAPQPYDQGEINDRNFTQTH